VPDPNPGNPASSVVPTPTPSGPSVAAYRAMMQHKARTEGLTEAEATAYFDLEDPNRPKPPPFPVRP
jgi:hypothetical protein